MVSMPLALRASELLDKAGQMLGRAGGREGAGQREQRHFLAGEQFIGGHRLGPAVLHLHEGGGRNFVAHFDRHVEISVLS